MASLAAQLRKLLQENQPIIAPGAYDAFSAMMIEKAGFSAVYMTGYGISASLLGKPDIGLISLKEMAQQAENIASAINVPLIADADNGYGNELNVARTVEMYERAGVAAIQIEDQVSPKKCGHMSNKSIVPFKEAVQKVRAAVRARSNPDTIIIARTDARGVVGVEEALKRCKAFAEEGADVLFFEAPRTEEEIRLVAEELKGQVLLANMVEGGATPIIPSEELYKLGYKIIIYPITAFLNAAWAMQRGLNSLKEKGYSTPKDTVFTWGELTELIGLSKYNRLAEELRGEDNIE